MVGKSIEDDGAGGGSRQKIVYRVIGIRNRRTIVPIVEQA
jgi:hypothetical protein